MVLIYRIYPVVWIGSLYHLPRKQVWLPPRTKEGDHYTEYHSVCPVVWIGPPPPPGPGGGSHTRLRGRGRGDPIQTRHTVVLYIKIPLRCSLFEPGCAKIPNPQIYNQTIRGSADSHLNWLAHLDVRSLCERKRRPQSRRWKCTSCCRSTWRWSRAGRGPSE
jgi:hypothetical protein